MRTIWGRLTLECYRQPGDTKKAPWYAYPLVVVFVTCLYGFMQMADAAGF